MILSSSPELCKNQAYGKKSDIWALGVILYQLISLNVPFVAGDMPRLINKILYSQFPPLPPRTPRYLKDMVDKMLNKSPNVY